MHQEVLENLQSIHGALLRMNRSIQAEGTFGIIKYDCWYKRIVRRGLESNGRAVENGIRSTPFFTAPTCVTVKINPLLCRGREDL